MTERPGIPKEPRSFADRGGQSMDMALHVDGGDLSTDVLSAKRGDADASLKARGRYGSLGQNLTTHWKVQER